jgi:hypothetical protein
VVRRNGSGSAGATTPHGARKCDALGTRPPSSRSPKEPQPACYGVSDGRFACGIVVPSARGTFIAIDRDGNVIGRFPTLREAATALPVGGAS